LIHYFKVKKLKSELQLIKPIFEILHSDQQWDEIQSKFKYSNIENNDFSEELVHSVLSYISNKLLELSDYFSTLSLNNRNRNQLSFFIDYINHLKNYTKNTFELKYLLQYMLFFNELVLGSERYLTIRAKIEELES
jgi:hypothetical protein